ncbi:MAG: hypothetical protein CML01_11460 [Pseudomonas sp.]|nr:hypothetical protein [Pseudomonas sp.]
MSMRLMETLAALAKRTALRPLGSLCEQQKQVSTARLEQMLEPIGDDLAGYAFVLRGEFDRLRAENETLRQDAARWKFVRSPVGTSSPFAVWHEGKMPVFSRIADRMVDDAMAKEASHV